MRRSPLSYATAPVALLALLALMRAPALPEPGWQAFGAVVALVAGMAAAALGGHRVRAAGACGVVAIAGALWAAGAHRSEGRLEERLAPELEGVELAVTGVVDALPTALERGHRFVLRVESCEPVRAPRVAAEADGTGGANDARSAEQCVLPPRVSLGWQIPVAGRAAPSAAAIEATPYGGPVPALRAGERWALTVRLRRPHALVNPGAFDRELRWLQEGIGAVGTVRTGRRLDPESGRLADRVERLRGTIRDGLYDAVDPARAREAGLLAALAIGDQAAIDPAWWTVFNRTGVGHLMSISGLHITMVAALGGLAIRRLWRSRLGARAGLACRVTTRTASVVAAVAVAFAYARLAGWGIPAQRTCWMLAAGAWLLVSRRTGSIVAALGLAVIAIVALDPWAPLTAGFWLSFGAVAAIVWAGSGVRHAEPGRLRRALVDAARTQWAATVALVPLGAWFFTSASVVGPVANAVAIPLVSAVITPVALVGGAVALASPALAGWLLDPCARLVGGLVATLEVASALPAAAIALPPPGLAALAVACAGSVLLLAPRGVPGRLGGLLALLPIAAAPIDRPPPGEIRVTALDVGQGTAVVIQVGARTLLYDTGPTMGQQLDSGGRVILPWLHARGIGRLDALVVSHADADHAGGALTVLASMPPEWMASSLPDAHPIVAAAPRSLRCRRGEGWTWDGVAFEWLHPADPPDAAPGSGTNAVSCVLRIRGEAGGVLLAGDIEAAVERRLVARYGTSGLASDVLLVPHHGSATSSTEAFIDAVAPRWALVQVGYRSRYRHPSPRVIERYARRDIRILRSDADGAIQLRLSPAGPPGVTLSRHEPARWWRVPVPP